VLPSFLNKDPSKHLAKEHGITFHKNGIFHSSFLVATIECIVSMLNASGLLLAAFVDVNFIKKLNSTQKQLQQKAVNLYNLIHMENIICCSILTTHIYIIIYIMFTIKMDILKKLECANRSKSIHFKVNFTLYLKTVEPSVMLLSIIT